MTNVDIVDQADGYIRDMRGIELRTPGLLGQRIKGTVHRFENYPVTNAATPAVTINATYPLFDPKTGTDHDVIVATNADGKTEFYVDTSANNSGTWQRLTRVIKGTIDTVGASASAQFKMLLSGMTEDGILATGIASAIFDGWIVINKTRTDIMRCMSSVLTDSSTKIQLTLMSDPDTHGWTAGDVIWVIPSHGLVVQQIDALDYGTSALVNFNPIEAQRKINIHIGKNESGVITGQLPWRVQYRNAQKKFFWLNPFAKTVTSASDTTPIVIVTSTAHGMETGDAVYIHDAAGNTAANGRFIVTKISGTSLSLDNSAGNGTYTGSGLLNTFIPIVTDNAGWYLDSPLPTKTFVKMGDSETQRIGSSGLAAPVVANLYDFDNNITAWGKIDINRTEGSPVYRDGTDAGNILVTFYGYVVPVYDGYQRGNPICQFYTGVTDASHTPIPTVSIAFNSGMVSPLLTGFEIYGAMLTVDQYTGGIHEPADSEYKLVKRVFLSSPNVENDKDGKITVVYDPTNVTGFDVVISVSLPPEIGYWETTNIVVPNPLRPTVNIIDISISASILQAQGQASVQDMLGHAVLKSGRTYITPRYAMRSRRSQGAVSVVDINDGEIAVSFYSGTGAHMDDVYDDLEFDNVNYRHRFYLNSRGPMLGLGVDDNKVVVYKPSEMEIVNLDTGEQNLITIDCSSRRGILHTPHGEIWAGQRGIYQMERALLTTQLLVPWKVFNAQMLNKYDGTLKTPDGTEYITAAYKDAIVAGYDPHHDVAWFQVQTNIDSSTSEYLCYCYGFQTEKWWVDKRNLPSPIVAFVAKTDKTFTICHATGILKYPNISGALRFEDDVKLVGGVQTTNNRGRETFLHFVFGSTYGLHTNITLWDTIIDAIGKSVDGLGLYTVEFYADDITTPFATLTVPIDAKSRPLPIPPWAEMERLSMKLKLPDASLTNFLEWDIRTIENGIVPHKRLGTR